MGWHPMVTEAGRRRRTMVAAVSAGAGLDEVQTVASYAARQLSRSRFREQLGPKVDG